MTSIEAGARRGVACIAAVVRREVWLALVEPVWPRGHLRLLGAAGIAEGLFLLLISGTAPVGEVGLLTLVAGETAFVASFAPARVSHR